MPDSNTQIAAEPLVRVYNKRGHTLIHGKHRAVAQAFSTVPKTVAELWMKQFPDGVVEASEAQKEINGAAAEASELREKLAAALKQIAALEAKPVNAGKVSSQLSALQAQLDAVTKRADAAEATAAQLEEQLTRPAPARAGSDMV